MRIKALMMSACLAGFTATAHAQEVDCSVRGNGTSYGCPPDDIPDRPSHSVAMDSEGASPAEVNEGVFRFDPWGIPMVIGGFLNLTGKPREEALRDGSSEPFMLFELDGVEHSLSLRRIGRLVTLEIAGPNGGDLQRIVLTQFTEGEPIRMPFSYQWAPRPPGVGGGDTAIMVAKQQVLLVYTNTGFPRSVRMGRVRGPNGNANRMNIFIDNTNTACPPDRPNCHLPGG